MVPAIVTSVWILNLVWFGSQWHQTCCAFGFLWISSSRQCQWLSQGNSLWSVFCVHAVVTWCSAMAYGSWFPINPVFIVDDFVLVATNPATLQMPYPVPNEEQTCNRIAKWLGVAGSMGVLWAGFYTRCGVQDALSLYLWIYCTGNIIGVEEFAVGKAQPNRKTLQWGSRGV